MINFENIKKAVLFSTIIFCLNLALFGQTYNPGLHIITRLKTFFSTYAPEKAYLQFDKPYYAAGDTIYFKAYVTEGVQHQLSGLSGVLHVDFINPENKIDQSIKLQIDSGLCWGDFPLADSLLAGNYRIRAYTQWMRNMGETSFFDRTIPVGSLKKEPVLISKENQLFLNSEADIQFFPEGGSVVTGIRTKVAFKAIGTNGVGINVKGVILDDKNKQVSTFASTHLGMGYFFLSPAEGKTYKTKLTFDDGSESIVDLPKPEASGITLTVNNDSISKISFMISVNEPYYKANRNKDFLLLIYSGGKSITYPFKLKVPLIILDIQKRLLHTGVTTVTLFSPDDEPLCERLLFVQNHDQLNLRVQADKTEYKKREKVSLLFNAKNIKDSTVSWHFSVSVIDENKVPADENNERNILTDLLLTSNLKGYVEQPNYYFNDTNETARENLDALMLTQGYRLFEWKQVIDTNYTPLVYQPEKALDISGKVTNLFGKPLANATVNLIPYKGDTILTRESDNKGIFHFSNVAFTDTIHIVLSAVNSKGRNSTKLIYFNYKDEPAIMVKRQSVLQIVRGSSMSAYLENAKKIREEYIKYDTGKAIVLKEVKVKGKNPQYTYHTQSLAGAGFADQVMHTDEIERIGGQLSTSLNGRLHGIGFSNDTPYLRTPPGNGPMLVVIDGAEVNMKDPSGHILPFGINEIPSSEVETVEVLKYANASIYGMDGVNGVLIITTKQGEDAKDTTSVGVLSIAPIGFYRARKFYSPKYDYANVSSERPDLRSTIYWNPEIKTDKDGNASFDFYNADGTGTYKVTIEGIDDNGNIGRLVYRYKVE